jgi:hypothetical protein
MLKITLLLNNVTTYISPAISLQLKYTINHCHKIQYMRHTKTYMAISTEGESTSEYNKKKVIYEHRSSEMCFLSYILLKNLKCVH